MANVHCGSLHSAFTAAGKKKKTNHLKNIQDKLMMPFSPSLYDRPLHETSSGSVTAVWNVHGLENLPRHFSSVFT